MKVGIAHHDAAARSALERMLVNEFRGDCVFAVSDARALLQRLPGEKPEILLLDVDLQGLPLVELTQRVMKDSPCALLLLENADSHSMSEIFECLGQGATDVARLPALGLRRPSAESDDFRQRLTTLMRLSGFGRPAEARPKAPQPLAAVDSSLRLIVLGASTGGPKALTTVLGGLGDLSSAAVVIVQHLDAHFYQELSEWLHTSSQLPVVAVKAPLRMKAGHVYLAARPEHLILTDKDRLGFSSAWPELICRPSIDVFFKSVAEFKDILCAGALLTGMGRDGAEGLLAMRQAGFLTVAQDAKTSVIDGMPKAARDLGAASRVLPLADIGPNLSQWLLGQCPKVTTEPLFFRESD